MSDSMSRLERLFHEALSIRDAGERAAFLERECGGDLKLRSELERMLAANTKASAGAFLEPITIDAGRVAEQVGTQIGPYKLLQLLGEGGFGVVYLAEQSEPVKRKVALKIIKPGMDSKAVIARFEAERQALALMDHPHIARVLDGGMTATGRPYFVMELVKGISITKFCDQEKLGLRERMELFVPVCQAVQHAHQKGIIHRDLKPSNVLIALYDGKPVVKVIDFGVAKATGASLTDATLHTQVGQMIGTLEYMAPEQAELNNLDIDTRADIYSLGVILYELMTGAPPFSGKELMKAGYAQMLKMIREQEPEKPSTRLSRSDELPSIAAARKLEPTRLARLLHNEPDWIVMKCLEKERARRYETANALAADIGRYLNNEPVAAGPVSRVYRMRKFLRRNKGPALAASLVFLVLVGGVIGTTYGLFEARRERDEKEVAREEAVASAGKAEDEAKKAQQVLGFFEDNVFAAARPEGQEGGLGKDVTLRQAIDAAEPKIGEAFKDRPLVEAQIRDVLGKTYYFLGEHTQSMRQFERVVALDRQNLGADHESTLADMTNLASNYSALGREAEAVELFEQVLAIQREKLGADHHATLATMNNLANGYDNLGRYEEGLRLHEQTVALCREKLGAEHPMTITCMIGLGRIYNVVGRPADGLKLNEETLALCKAKLGPDHPNTLMCLGNLAISYAMTGRYAEASKLFEEDYSLSLSKLGPDHPSTIAALSELAQCDYVMGRVDEALKRFEDVVAQSRVKLGADHPDTLRRMTSLAACYTKVGRITEAVRLSEESLTLCKEKLGPDHPQSLLILRNLATLYAAVGRHEEAYKLREEVLALLREKLGPDHPDTLLSMKSVADGLVALDRGVEAVTVIDECLKRTAGKIVHPQLIPGIVGLRLQVFQKKSDAAGCVETAGLWEALGRNDADSLYNSARIRAVCSALSTGTAAAEQADLAMGWLSKAVGAGYKEIEQMKNDPDLDALRGREDFKALIAELEAGDDEE